MNPYESPPVLPLSSRENRRRRVRSERAIRFSAMLFLMIGSYAMVYLYATATINLWTRPEWRGGDAPMAFIAPPASVFFALMAGASTGTVLFGGGRRR